MNLTPVFRVAFDSSSEDSSLSSFSGLRVADFGAGESASPVRSWLAPAAAG